MKKYLLFLVSILLIVIFLLYKINMPKQYNVILISLDLLQAKQLHSYGYPLNTTPNLDAVLNTSYLFTNTIAPSSWTTPSVASLFTSLYPAQHDVIHKYVSYDIQTKKGVYSNIKKLNRDTLTLAEILRQNSYSTVAFTGNGGVDPRFGFNIGFQLYYATADPADKIRFKPRTFADTVPKAVQWLKNNKNKKFFLYLQGFDLHNKEDPPQGYDYRYVKKPYYGKYKGFQKDFNEMKEQSYEGTLTDFTKKDLEFWQAIHNEKINNADQSLKKFFEILKELDLFDNTLIIFTSAHGEEYFEHGRFGHARRLYDESIHVPLAIRLPKQTKQYKINSLASLVDIMPTILGILNIKNTVSNRIQGLDLSQLLYSPSKKIERVVFSGTNYANQFKKNAVQTSDGWKLIYNYENSNISKELYNLQDDPKELIDLSTQKNKILYEMEQKLSAYMSNKK